MSGILTRDIELKIKLMKSIVNNNTNIDLLEELLINFLDIMDGYDFGLFKTPIYLDQMYDVIKNIELSDNTREKIKNYIKKCKNDLYYLLNCNTIYEEKNKEKYETLLKLNVFEEDVDIKL